MRFINQFEVPDDRDAEFLDLWRRVNAHMTAQPGYRGHELHRAVLPGTRARFVNYVSWQSRQHWEQAHGPAFRALVSGPEWADYPATPGLYEVVDRGGDPAHPAA